MITSFTWTIIRNRLAPYKHFNLSSLAYHIQRSLLILIENTLKEEDVE